VMVFFSIMKIFKYMHHVEQISFMFRVVGSASTELAAFFFSFIIILIAFAMFVLLLFGSRERQFLNLPTAILSLLRMSVGTLDYDYILMKEQNAWGAGLFILSFLLAIMLVSVNFFIAILTDSYSRKKAQIEKFMAYRKLARIEGTSSPGRHCHSTLSWTVIDRHSLGIYTVILRSLLLCSDKMTVSPWARHLGHEPRPLRRD
jgi:hypothetical protein